MGINGIGASAVIADGPDSADRMFLVRAEVLEALLAEVFPQLADGSEASRSASLVEPVTDAESRVLRLLPSNLSGPDIARELYLSVNTVRTHVRHIYQKLGVRGRREAVDRARELRILPSLAPHRLSTNAPMRELRSA